MVGFHQFFSQEFVLIKDQLKVENQQPEKVKKITDDLLFVISGFFGYRKNDAERGQES
ncbi:hypothetical protein [Chryseobacterium sp. HMWF035]|uniref:hypothetical protein n=1 Tax=Chryseobacterium sp. HMWF035 TaxID=2056868 RepID=UPI00140285A3|nr:hypothetical protein [Chryseobacterium sp. HMWF035]